MTRYAVLGPGGVGGLLAVLLSNAGHEVVVIARPESVDALRENGFHLHSASLGDREARVDVVPELDREVDAVLVTPKATLLEAALPSLPSEVVGEALVIPFLNGVDHLGRLREAHRSVVAGVIRVESTRVAPGVIEHGSAFARIELAATGELGERAAGIVADLVEAGFEARLVPDEQAMLWGKLSFLAPFALLTTGHGVAVGEVRTTHSAELEAVVREVMAVSAAEGGPSDVDAVLRAFHGFGPESKSSMLRDAEAGNTLEIDAIGGAVVRAARAHGIEIPHTEALVAQLSG